MKVLLTGSHGLIGRALARQLAAGDHTVVALVRKATAGPAGSHTGATAIAWDPPRGWVDGDALRSAGPFDAVVNLAGAGIASRRWTPARRRQLFASRVLSTQVLVSSLRRLDPPPAVLVNASAVGYYGDRDDELLDEHSEPGGGFLAGLCRAWEDEAAVGSDTFRVACVRSGVVLSTRGGALARQLPLFRFGAGARLGNGEQYLSWITLRDEVSAILRVIDDDALAGPVNAVAPGPVTNAAFTVALGRALARPTFLAVPGWAIAAALGTDLANEMLLASQRVRPARLEAAGHRFADPHIDGALVDLLSRQD